MQENISDKIRSAANIVEVIGGYLSLKKKGSASYIALCPFHNDTHASLTVSAIKQIYKCFSCGAGGDVFRFLMDYKNLSFPDALTTLAKKYHIALPKQSYSSHKHVSDAYLQQKAINGVAANLYHHYLIEHKNGLTGRDYARSRGLTKKAVTNFQIGYAPDSWDFIQSSLLKAGFSEKEILQSGLTVLRKNSSGSRDFFKNRLMFPIKNERGEVVGFGGRALKEEDAKLSGKYINSKDSPFYQKRLLLYGLQNAYQINLQNKDKNKNIVLTEGYLDVIACQSNAIGAVAPLGTALTMEQANKLKRYANTITVVFDGDNAGIDASLKAARVLIQNEINAYVCLLPQNQGIDDPYDFIQKQGAANFRIHLEKNKQDAFSFFLQTTIVNKNPTSALTPIEKNDVVVEMQNLLHSIKTATIRSQYETTTANVLQLDVNLIKQKNAFVKPNINYKPNPTRLAPKNPSVTVLPPTIQCNIEKTFILLLISNPANIIKAITLFTPEDLADKLACFIYKKLINIGNHNNLNVNRVLDNFTDATIYQYLLKEVAQEEAMYGESNSEREKDDQLNECLARLKEKIIDGQIIANKNKMAHANQSKDNEQIKMLQETNTRLIIERQAIRDHIATTN